MCRYFYLFIFMHSCAAQRGRWWAGPRSAAAVIWQQQPRLHTTLFKAENLTGASAGIALATNIYEAIKDIVPQKILHLTSF